MRGVACPAYFMQIDRLPTSQYARDNVEEELHSGQSLMAGTQREIPPNFQLPFSFSIVHNFAADRYHISWACLR